MEEVDLMAEEKAIQLSHQVVAVRGMLQAKLRAALTAIIDAHTFAGQLEGLTEAVRQDIHRDVVALCPDAAYPLPAEVWQLHSAVAKRVPRDLSAESVAALQKTLANYYAEYFETLPGNTGPGDGPKFSSPAAALLDRTINETVRKVLGPNDGVAVRPRALLFQLVESGENWSLAQRFDWKNGKLAAAGATESASVFIEDGIPWQAVAKVFARGAALEEALAGVA